MKQYYIATLEIVVDDEEMDFPYSTVKPSSDKLVNHEFKIIGIIKTTHEHQKKRLSFKVCEGTLKRHVRELYDDIIKPRPDGN